MKYTKKYYIVLLLIISYLAYGKWTSILHNKIAGMEIINVHAFVVDINRFILATIEQEQGLAEQFKKSKSWFDAFKTTSLSAVTGIRSTESKKIILFWDNINFQWKPLQLQPPVTAVAITLFKDNLYALGYEKNHTIVMKYQDDVWHIIPLLVPFSFEQWGKGIECKSEFDSLWITFIQSNILQTAYCKIDDYVRVTEVYPYKNVSIGVDKSLWALHANNKELIQDNTSIALEHPLQQLYAVNKDLCYATDENGKMYIWHTIMKTFIPFFELPLYSLCAVASNNIYAVDRSGQLFIWQETEAEKNQYIQEVAKHMQKAPKSIEAIAGAPLPAPHAEMIPLPQDLQLQMAKFGLKKVEPKIQEHKITREEYIQEKYPPKLWALVPYVPEKREEPVKLPEEQKLFSVPIKKIPVSTPYQPTIIMQTKQESLDGKPVIESKPTAKNITQLVTWTALLSRLKTAIQSYLTPYIPNVLLNWLNIQPKQQSASTAASQ